MKIDKLSTINKKQLNISLILLFCFTIYGLAILQDYFFSRLKSTGFYWSDTMLYNIYWLLFIPFIQVAKFSYYKHQPKSLKGKILFSLGYGIIFSALHIVIFTSLFILMSHLIYPVPHKFSTILKNAISNQSQITIITYLCFPFIIAYLSRKKLKEKDISRTKFITIKNGNRRVKIDTSTILLIQSDRPYTSVITKEKKLLHNESLKRLEKLLNPQDFIRVHRSAIINKHHITEMTSRKNGDYDGIISNGQTVRLSRHYRQNWIELLNH